ncbi:MAG: RDD family protein [Opitutae bacterium]|nr:RDD family protein [Opitutae bacterium]
MNQNRTRLLTLWLALALAILPALRAQEAPPATPAPEKPATIEPAKPDETTVESSDDEEEKSPDAVAPAEEPKKAETPAAPAAEEAKPADEAPMRDLTKSEPSSDPKPAKRKSTRSRSYGTQHGGDIPLGNHVVPAGQQWGEIVSIMGDSIVDGDVADAAVSVNGNTTVNGTVGDAAVSILGTTRVNGKVKGSAVAVLGDVILGPNAEVGDEVVAVLGRVVREPGSVVHGGVQQIGGFGPFVGFEWLRAWVHQCLFWGRPLGFGEHLGWAWIVAGCFLAFYALLALLFPKAIDRCAETLEQRPGGTLLAALLAVLISPLLVVLLAITGVGLVLIPFLAMALFFAGLFGKAAVLAWLGRRITKLLGDGAYSHAFFTVLIGGVITMLLYTIPFGGFILRTIFGFLGMGAVIYTLALAMKSSRPAKPAPATPMTPRPTSAPAATAAATAPMAATTFTSPAMPVQSAGFGAETPSPDAPPPSVAAAAVPPVTEATPPVYGAATPAGAVPPLISATLPRAGFWIRVAAAFLDCFMIAVALGVLDFMHRGPAPMFVTIAAYCAVMWKLKGTTIGGIVCGLKVVRLDDREIDWGVAIVRALSAFLSFFCAGLGFIWVAFDDEKQSWHDKIAGTTIVRVPKGTPLL